jgi:hypothetical protein
MLHLLLCQCLPANPHSLIQATQIAESTNGNRALLNDPGERHLAHLPALLLRELVRPFDDFLDVCVFVSFEHGVPLHTLLTFGDAGFWGTCQQATIQRCPGDETNARFVAEGVHFALFFAVAERIVVS